MDGRQMIADQQASEVMRGVGDLWRRRRAPFWCLVLGIAILAFLEMVPIWNSLILMNDPVYEYFFGHTMPVAIIYFCMSVIVAYSFAILLFFRCTKLEAQTEQTMLMLSNVFILLLGVSALMIVRPMHGSGETFSMQINENCEYGSGSHALYKESVKLNAIRQAPSCAQKPSIEGCSEFQPSRYSSVLKAMETNLMCSGWCAKKEMLADTGTGSARTSAVDYPPTLFSLANFEASCDGMTARSIDIFLKDFSSLFFYEGTYLMFISIGIGFLKLIGFCTMDRGFAKSRSNVYGATMYADFPSNDAVAN